MNMTGMEPFELIAKRAEQNARRRIHQQKIVELVGLIDELSGDMGVSDFVTAVRAHGYNIEADGMALIRRGITTH
jgi:hypothetical protein